MLSPSSPTKKDWPGIAGRKLRFRRDLEATFKALQPFVTGKDAPKHEPLWVLEELWNIDKHRYPHLTHASIGARGIRAALKESFPGTDPLPEGDEPAFQWTIEHAPGPFVDGAELARFVEPEAVAGLHPAVYVKTDLVFDVAFDQRPPAYGGLLVPTLWDLQETVHDHIDRFAGELGWSR